MLSANTWSTLLRVAVGLALPTIACFSYYTVGALSESSGWSALAVSFAYPVAILSLLGCAAVGLSKRRSPALLASAGLGFALSASLLIYLHFK